MPALRSSSSGSWSRDAAPGGDIIDLDRYMRQARPPDYTAPRRDDNERLVVDGGGGAGSTHSSYSARDKRYSHDSGLSDDSYRRHRRPRRHPRYRRVEASNGATRSSVTTNSMRTFRENCERALKDQQEQIARVAQLCERLTVAQAPGPAPAPPPARPRTPSLDSSELSSSSRSRSTRDLRRRDKHRSQECKTYKIIMTKLDELNRLFVARGRVPLRPRRSSASVSVCDKLIATEPLQQAVAIAATYTQPVVCRNYCSPANRGFVSRPASRPPSTLTPTALRARRYDAPKTDAPTQRRYDAPKQDAPTQRRYDAPPDDAHETHATQRPPDHTLDIHRSGRLNVASDSVNNCDTHTIMNSSSTVQDPSSEFDLEDPVHLYEQAKRLGSMPEGGYLRSPEPRPAEVYRATTRAPLPPAPRPASLCTLCRSYWRALRTCLQQQIFNKNDAA